MCANYVGNWPKWRLLARKNINNLFLNVTDRPEVEDCSFNWIDNGNAYSYCECHSYCYLYGCNIEYSPNMLEFITPMLAVITIGGHEILDIHFTFCIITLKGLEVILEMVSEYDADVYGWWNKSIGDLSPTCVTWLPGIL